MTRRYLISALHPKVSAKIRKIANKFNMKAIFTSQNTLRSNISRTKQPTNKSDTSDVAYSIPCEPVGSLT